MRQPQMSPASRAGVFVALTIGAGCSPLEDMTAQLDAVRLPDDLILIRETRGPPRCFAGDCPYVHRLYGTDRAVSAVCMEMVEAVKGWGVARDRWSVHVSELNPCTGSARRGRYWFSLAVYSSDRLRGSDEAIAAVKTVVSVGLRAP